MGGSATQFFCFGLGYTAQALAARLASEGWPVAGTCRSAEKAEALAARGIEALVWDGTATNRAIVERLARSSHILVSVPPGEDGDPVINAYADAISANDDLRWLGYLSTTGVYGDWQGGWVDEDSELRPANARSRRRQAAEDDWLNLWRASQVPVHIFRLAGIYGPGNSIIERLRGGRARQIVKAGQVFSRIHVDDIVQVLMASMAAPDPGRIYNVADDEAAAPDAVVRYAAEALGMAPPPAEPFETAELSEMARSFYGECKRVRNRRIKEDLGVKLKYPTYHEGISALVGDIG